MVKKSTSVEEATGLLAHCRRDELAEALVSAARLAATRSALPQCSHVLLVAEEASNVPGARDQDGGLRLVVNNLEIALEERVPATVETVGSLTVPAMVLSDYISGLRDEEVTLAVDTTRGRQLRIACGRDSATLAGGGPADFPPVPDVGEGGLTLDVDAKALVEAIGRVEFAASKDVERPVLQCVLLDVEAGQVTLVAADGFRLAKTVVRQATGVQVSTPVVVPARALREVRRLASELDGSVRLRVNGTGSLARFEMRGAALTTQLMRAEYPDYRRLIPAEAETSAVAYRKNLLQACGLASVFLKEVGLGRGPVRLQFVPGGEEQLGKVLVSSRSEEVGDQCGEVDAKVDGPELKIAIAAAYLASALQVMKSEQVLVGATVPMAPVTFRPADEDGFVVVVMPLFVAW